MALFGKKPPSKPRPSNGFKTEVELAIWNYVYLQGTRNNIALGQFNMKYIQFGWPWIFAAQLSATKIADLALVEYRAGRLDWPM